MAGFLRGWLREQPLADCCALRQRLRRARRLAPRLRAGDAELDRAARTSSPTARPSARCAATPRSSICTASTDAADALAGAGGARLRPSRPARGARRRGTAPTPRRASPRFKALLAEGASPRRRARARAGSAGFGVILDDRYGEDDAADAHRQRRAGSPGRSSCPGRGRSRSRSAPTSRWRCAPGRPSTSPSAWSATIPDDPAELRAAQLERLRALQAACVGTDRELLVEVIPPREAARARRHLARALEQIYAAGIRPDWWKLPPPASAAAWSLIDAAIARHDPHCRGVLLLGLEASEDDARGELRQPPRRMPVCRGFAVGRSIFARRGRGLVRGHDERRRGRRRRRRALRPARRRSGARRATAWTAPHRPSSSGNEGHRMSTLPRIGFIGIGMMGHGMAKNLLAKGYPLTFKVNRDRSSARRPDRRRRAGGEDERRGRARRRHRLPLRLGLAADRGHRLRRRRPARRRAATA